MKRFPSPPRRSLRRLRQGRGSEKQRAAAGDGRGSLLSVCHRCTQRSAATRKEPSLLMAWILESHDTQRKAESARQKTNGGAVLHEPHILHVKLQLILEYQFFAFKKQRKFKNFNFDIKNNFGHRII